jgi:tellurite resistance protein
MTTETPSLSPCDALVAVMVAVSASDATVRTSELVAIQRMVDHAPVFAEYDDDRIRIISQTVMALFEEEEGLDAFFGLIREALPEKLYETAYALACDVGAADGRLYEGEIALLAEIRHQFDIPRLHAAAIELSAQVRHRVL